MSQKENLEAWMTTHSQVCKAIENRIREEVDGALRQAYNETGDAVVRALEAARERQSTEMQHTFENLEETLREAGISHYNSSRQSLQDKDLEITQLRGEYEAKLKAKDEEFIALKESVNDLRQSILDKDAIITTAIETNKRQLEEQAKLFKAKEEAIRLSMAEQKTDAEQELQIKNAKLEQQLRQADQEIELERADRQMLSEQVKEYSRTVENIRKTTNVLSNDNKELLERQNKAMAIEKRIDSNEISAMLYKLSLETSRFTISPILGAQGWSLFAQVLNAIFEAGSTNRLRTFVYNVKDERMRCFPSVCTMNEFPEALTSGICEAHNDECPKIRVIVEEGGYRRTVYFDQ